MEVDLLKRLRVAAFVILCLWFLGLIVSINCLLSGLQATNPGLPFGILSVKGEILAQDFAYNRLFFQGIAERIVAHPYRFSDQEILIRHLLPGMHSGMTHAYSPVAFVLAQPLLHLSGAHAFLVYTIMSAAGTLLVFYFFLLPRAAQFGQILALLVCALSIWVLTSFALGQSVLLTLPVLGALWALLLRRQMEASLPLDLIIAVLFWALCLKPSVAIIPAMLLLGARAWRPLFLAAGLLILTWIFTAPYYGGWWDGFWDYLYLLNHYSNSVFPAFLQRGHETVSGQHWTAFLFSLFRASILISTLTLVVLRWLGRISASEQFQGTVWAFLLLSPYLLPTENWILCLVVVEGTFFQSQNRALLYGKLLLLAALMNFREDVIPHQLMELPLKWLLFAWILTEYVICRKNRERTELPPSVPVLP